MRMSPLAELTIGAKPSVAPLPMKQFTLRLPDSQLSALSASSGNSVNVLLRSASGDPRYWSTACAGLGQELVLILDRRRRALELRREIDHSRDLECVRLGAIHRVGWWISLYL